MNSEKKLLIEHCDIGEYHEYDDEAAVEFRAWLQETIGLDDGASGSDYEELLGKLLSAPRSNALAMLEEFQLWAHCNGAQEQQDYDDDIREIARGYVKEELVDFVARKVAERMATDIIKKKKRKGK